MIPSLPLDLKKNIFDRCIYLKVSGSKIIFLILYVDDILLTANDFSLLHKTKEFKVLERFRMETRSASVVPIWKRDKLSLMQCPKNKLERKQMEIIPYAFVI